MSTADSRESNVCSSDSFQDPNTVVYLTTSIICLLLSIATTALWLRRRKALESVRNTLPKSTFGTALVFAILNYVFQIVYIPVSLCTPMSRATDTGLSIPAVWFGSLSDLIVYGIIAFSLSAAISRASGVLKTRRVVHIGNLVIWYLLVALTIVILVATTVDVVRTYGDYDKSGYENSGYVVAIISMATYALYLLGAIYVGIIVSVRLNRSRTGSGCAAGAKRAGIFTVVMLFVARFLIVLYFFGWGLGGLRSTVTSQTTFGVLQSLCLALTALGAVYTASYLDDRTADASPDAMTYGEDQDSIILDHKLTPIIRT